MDKLRVDIWLWATRQLKSRSLATSAARAGHVRINGEPAKASAPVRVGDEVRLRIQGFDRILRVLDLPPKRLGAPAAQQCYQDLTPPRPRYIPVAVRDKGAGRPTKKERRQLEALRGEEWARDRRR
ncbi:RNA-binding S4 domain-containing protein [Scrofimicrobium sp. R131]|uniref:RNA-binding S4 domain-containing protein n=1 Tax=Scrofimicrobium appendicitidis TaxID=3079930 RepID=A0AAU7V817_9ACTO